MISIVQLCVLAELIAETVIHCGFKSISSFNSQSKVFLHKEASKDFTNDFVNFRHLYYKSKIVKKGIFPDVLNNFSENVNGKNNSQFPKYKVDVKKKKLKYDVRKKQNQMPIGQTGFERTSHLIREHSNKIVNLKVKEKGNFKNNTDINENGYNLVFADHNSKEKFSEKSHGTNMSVVRQKRSIIHLYNMMVCATGCNPLSYKGYGCFCGFLGSGYVVDGIDSCCKIHDECYFHTGCPAFLEYFVPYVWKCYANQPICGIGSRWFGRPATCAERLCECDRQLALCLRKYPCPAKKLPCASSPRSFLHEILYI